MKSNSSRLPYLFAAMALALLMTLVLTNRDRLNPPMPGNPAPSFTFPDLEGKETSLGAYRGKVVLVNVWATNCAPCVREMPSMQRLYEELEAEGFRILAISLDGEIGELGPSGYVGGDVEEFARSLGLTFPLLRDPEGRSRRIFQTTGIPESFLVGKDGMIYKKVIGAAEWDAPEMVALVRRLLDA